MKLLHLNNRVYGDVAGPWTRQWRSVLRDYRTRHYHTQFGMDIRVVPRSRLRSEDAGATPVRLPLKLPGDRFGGVGSHSGGVKQNE